MSRGSTLTLYKKFDLKIENEEFKKIVRKYAEYNKEHNHSYDFKTGKAVYKKMSEYAKDIPLIMSVNPFVKDTEYDEKTKKWVDVRPKKSIDVIKDRIVGYVDKNDKCYCAELMHWDFGSTFDCLVQKYGIAQYNFAGSEMEITTEMADKMLAAINYILDGDWSDKTERGMNNEFIKVFTEGNTSDSYWKYVYRNRASGKFKTFNINEDGYDITIKCPVEKKKKEDDDECHYDYEAEIAESNASIEYSLSMFRNGLTAFLYADNWSRHDYDEKDTNPCGWLGYDSYDNYKYMLTYEYWG